MEIFGGLLLIWLVHALIAGVLTAPIVFFSRRQIPWHRWEALAFVLPFVIWAMLLFIDDTGKSLANLGEPLYAAFAIPVAALLRVAIGRKPWEGLWAGTLLISICGVFVAAYFFVPGLPE